MDHIEQEQVTFKCERKMVRKFALETTKFMHSLCHVDRANKYIRISTKNMCHDQYPNHNINVDISTTYSND